DYAVGGTPFKWELMPLAPSAKDTRAIAGQLEQNLVFAAVPADEDKARSGNQVAQSCGLTRNKALKHLGDLVQLKMVLTKDGPSRSTLHWRAPSG
ncbi:MAG TPA: hypothetical protein VKR21_05510, partial [Solirubrobacteraceae bacterium]|nr:hypothetical protein [Solirubrobacteraceae bacterium]